MYVDDSHIEEIDKLVRDYSEVSGQDDEPLFGCDTMGLEGFDSILVILPASLCNTFVVEGDCLNVMFLGYVESWCVWSVADDNLDIALSEIAMIDRV